MTALPDWNVVSDAELAVAAAGGDRGAFAGIYDRYADRLYDCPTTRRCQRDATDATADNTALVERLLPTVIRTLPSA